jgi:Zn-dependent M28 family amino/carboxypeptidase
MNVRDVPARSVARLLAATLAAVLLAACTGSSRADGEQAAPTTTSRQAPPATRAGQQPASAALRAAVSAAGIRRHLAALQDVADRNGGNRAAGTAGYDASVQYVARQLRQAGYRPQVQRFDAGSFRDRSPPVLEVVGQATLRAGVDHRSFGFSGSAEASGRVRAVDLGSTSGCEPADFAGFPRGGVALLQRGTCPFRAKAEQAARAGAAAAVIFDPGQGNEALAGTLGSPGVAIPVLSASAEVGRRLAQAGPDQLVRVRVDAETTSRPTSNLLAELPGASGDRVVMLGAHLDSVAAGPGINDNASGSATVLELARNLAQTRPANAVRFAWWGGEELGLLGSRHYVAGLDRAERERIALYLNLDMVASPNFLRLVYDGDAREAPAGSEAIERVLTEQLRGQGLAVGETSLGRGSDHASFAAAGVPVGGLFTGAGEAKDERERAAYGGRAGAVADPCYHRRCDDLDNVDLGVLDQLADAAAAAVVAFARDTGPVDRAGRRP